MTELSGSSSADIDAPITRCWEVVQALDEAPAWQAGLSAVTVVEHDAAGRPAVCDIVFDAKMHRVRCRVAVAYDPPHRLTFTRLESEDVDEMECSWELTELPGDRTHATYRLTVDPGPVPLVARPLVRALRPLVVGGRAQELARAVADHS
jgi:uncharacterized protein YndB with AHSA1/START domain